MPIRVTFACDNPSCKSTVSFPINESALEGDSPRKALESQQWEFIQHRRNFDRNLYICPGCAKQAFDACSAYARQADKSRKKLRVAFNFKQGVWYTQYNTRTRQYTGWQAPVDGNIFALQPGKKITIILIAKGKQ